MQNDDRSFFIRCRTTIARSAIVAAVLCFVGAGLTRFASPVYAQLANGSKTLNETAKAAGIGGTTDLVQIIGRIIYIGLSFLGVILLGYLLYAGYLWMTAEGNPEQVKKAQTTIRNAIIGLLIIASSWAIVSFVMSALTGVQDGGLAGQNQNGAPPGLLSNSGSLGRIIEYHLPERDARNVTRNTPIIITFKEQVDPRSFIQGWTEANKEMMHDLNAANIQIYRTGDAKTALQAEQAGVYTKDFKTYVIRPKDLLGSAQVNVKYTVALKGGASGVQLLAGGPAFGGVSKDGYIWGFEVSTFVDLTPPKIVSVVPREGKYPRNIVVSVTFDEAVDPIGAAGVVKNGAGFTNVTLKANGGGLPIDGEYRIVNKYRTIEFTTDVSCGMNSCGKEIFCLPADATIDADVRAATLEDPQKPPKAKFSNQGFDGITDVVGNSLDGNGNDIAEGPDTDSRLWSFATSADIKKTPPAVLSTVPEATKGPGQSNRPVDESVTAVFDTLMQASTMNSEAAYITPVEPNNKNPDTFWYMCSMDLLNAKKELLKKGEEAAYAQLRIEHRAYLPSGLQPKDRNDYNPHLLSDLQDAYQNCFNPANSTVCTGKTNCCNNQPTDNPACAFK